LDRKLFISFILMFFQKTRIRKPNFFCFHFFFFLSREKRLKILIFVWNNNCAVCFFEFYRLLCFLKKNHFWICVGFGKDRIFLKNFLFKFRVLKKLKLSKIIIQLIKRILLLSKIWVIYLFYYVKIVIQIRIVLVLKLSVFRYHIFVS